MAIKRIPDNRDQLTRLGGQVNQFGRLETSDVNIVVNVEGRYGVLPARESAREIGGGALDGASWSIADATTELDSGTNADDSIRLESNTFLEYSPLTVAEASQFIVRDAAPTQNQRLRWGIFNDEDGLFFEESASGIHMVIRKNSVDTTLESIHATNPGAVQLNPDKVSLSSDLLDDGRVWFIRFSYYGAGRIIFGTRKATNLDYRNRGDTEEIYGVYDSVRDDVITKPYMRTANLPSRVEIENDPDQTTPPDQAMIVNSGERVIAVYDEVNKDRRVNTARFGPITVPSASRTGLVALRPAATFQTLPNDINVRIISVEFDTSEINNDIDIWTTIGSTLTATWTDSPYSEPESSVEIAARGSGGSTNITSVDTTGRQTSPRSFLRTGSASIKASREGATVSAPLGTERVWLVEGQASGADATNLYITIEWTESH